MKFGIRHGLLVAPDSWMVYPLLKCSLEVRHALRTTPESHFLAKVVAPFPANGTLATWNADFERNSIANSEAINLGANAYHYT